MKHCLSRRQFLKILGTAGAAGFLAACQRLVPPSPTATPSPTGTPTLMAVSSTPTLAPTPGPKALVAIGKIGSYDHDLLHSEIERMLDSLGGLSDIVSPGAKVGIKVNMTGAYYQNGRTNPPAVEYFATNPAVVGALGELLIDAGASKLYVMDGLGIAKRQVFDLWGYTDMAKSIGAELIDLCKPDPYPDFIEIPVGPNWFNYASYTLNPLLGELDTFISIGKMKPHSFAGVTLSMKNLMGITPLSVYRKYPGQSWRQSLHGDRQMDKRLGRTLLDLNRARPIHLAMADGIMTMQGGADAWEDGVSQVKPGLLVAGKNPVATDSVGIRLMGFDPAAAAGTVPFLHIENYIALAQEIGMGTIKLEEIGVTGYKIEEARFNFKPAP
jgi:uncharacterized protein (DUF362 family)